MCYVIDEVNAAAVAESFRNRGFGLWFGLWFRLRYRGLDPPESMLFRYEGFKTAGRNLSRSQDHLKDEPKSPIRSSEISFQQSEVQTAVRPLLAKSLLSSGG